VTAVILRVQEYTEAQQLLEELTSLAEHRCARIETRESSAGTAGCMHFCASTKELACACAVAVAMTTVIRQAYRILAHGILSQRAVVSAYCMTGVPMLVQVRTGRWHSSQHQLPCLIAVLCARIPFQSCSVQAAAAAA
jgi:hypothetical protein